MVLSPKLGWYTAGSELPALTKQRFAILPVAAQGSSAAEQTENFSEEDMAGIGLILAIVIAIIVVLFTVQNAMAVSVGFILWHTELPLAVVIFCSVLAGALLMFCLVLYKSLRDKWHSRRPAKTEIHSLKNEEASAEKKDEPAPGAKAASAVGSAEQPDSSAEERKYL
jgi:putative membrane protein